MTAQGTTLKPTGPHSRSFFKSISLIPFFAFVGLGADSLSSSSYGPEEAFLALPHNPHLIVYVGALTILTIWAISASYCQIIELFPRGGGGYLVASKLLSPFFGLVSGSALLVDYILTITISIASGVDAIYSLIPPDAQNFQLEVKVICVVLLTILNLRGIRESIFPWIPVFVLFVLTHAIAFAWSFFMHASQMPEVVQGTITETKMIQSTYGFGALFFLLIKAYSMGSGTYTGIEAVSNGMSIIREPKVTNAKRTMVYISLSLALTVSGLILSFLLYRVQPEIGRTLNSVLFEKIGQEMGGIWGSSFASVTIFSEMALLFVAAETGFLGGPQILANMAMDRWLPHRFMTLSDHYVMRHGLLLMGLSAIVVMIYTQGSVGMLVVLYSLSVFITFTLSQLGMVIHWLQNRKQVRGWLKKITINSIGLIFTVFVLVSLTIVKFKDGAWLTLLVVGSIVLVGLSIRRYYKLFINALSKIHRTVPAKIGLSNQPLLGRKGHTAILFISSLQGMSEHTLANLLMLFGDSIDQFVFLHIGLIDAGNTKGEEEIRGLKYYVESESNKLVRFMQERGYEAEAMTAIGIDIGDEIERLTKEVLHKFPHAIFFGGELVLPADTPFSRWLHNQTLHTIQRRMYQLEVPFVTIPVYIKTEDLKTMNVTTGILGAK